MSSTDNQNKKKEIVGGQEVKQGPINTIHPIRDFLGKDDNTNVTKNAIDNDVTDKWSYDAFPFQGVIDLGEPAKQIDYIRIASENEQPVTIDFSNDNTATGYSGKMSKNLKQGVNVIETRKDLVARYIRFEFTGNKSLDKDGNKKPDPIGIYYIQVGQGDEKKAPLPAPIPPVTEPQPEPQPPTKPLEGRIKNWGGDINKGAKSWKIVKMKDNAKLYKVVDSKGTNIADLFNTPQTAEAFVKYYIWKQGDTTPTEPNPEPNPNPNPNPNPQPGSGTDKNGVKLLVSNGSEISYDVKNNFRDDGKRFDFLVGGDWTASEATGYFRFTKDPVDDEVSIKWSEKSHSGSNAVQCYDTGVGIKDGKVRMRFENPHPQYSSNIGSGQGEPLSTKFIGYKGVKIPQSDGSVLVELYQDTGDNDGDKPANQWKKIYSHTDTKYKRSGAHPYVTLRIDDPAKNGQKNLEAKWMSVAKI